MIFFFYPLYLEGNFKQLEQGEVGDLTLQQTLQSQMPADPSVSPVVVRKV